MDDHLLDEYLIKALFTEFKTVDQELLQLACEMGLRRNPSPICPRTAYIYSPTVDKILFSRDTEEVECNENLII